MSVTTIPLLEDLQGPWAALQIRVVGPDAPAEPITLPDIYPFTSVTDLKRQLWIHMRGDPRWSPERVFVGVRGDGDSGIRPVEFHWPTSVMGGSVDLPDPLTYRAPSAALIDEAGNRKPIGVTMIGSLILETALSPEIVATGAIPVLEAISLAAIVDPEAGLEIVSPQLFGGYYQLYFPWLTAPAQVMDSHSTAKNTALTEAYAAAVIYTEDRVGRCSVVQRALRHRLGGASISMQTMVRLRWVMPIPRARPESLEKTFYGLRASERIPFIRYFPADRGTPLLKLGLAPDGSSYISDPRVFSQYINQPAPATKSAVILARVPMASAHVERGSAFTVYMFEDGACDITLEVAQRGATYIAAVAMDAQRILRDVLSAIGFGATSQPTLRDLHATYKWSHPDPRRAAPLSAARLAERVAALTPFFDVVPRVAEDTALLTCQWRAVSNYESESAQFAYITQLVLRGLPAGNASEEPVGGLAALEKYIADLSRRFGLTTEAARASIERWLERRGEAVAPAAGVATGVLAVPKHSTGASVAISGTHPEYLLDIQGVDTYEELQRLASVVGVLLGAPTTELRPAPPAPAVERVEAVVEMGDAVREEAAAGAGAPPPAEEVDLGEVDPAMAALMAELGMNIGGLGDAGEEMGPAVGDDAEAQAAAAAAAPALVVENLPAAGGAGAAAAAAAAPALDMDAALAAAEEECRGNPWRAGEPALKLKADWYMARLKKEDMVLFGYPGTKRVKTYSKSCQRRDERQPNIMTLAEYARVRRCYEGRVRFVDLPPRKPADLPRDPEFNPKGKRFNIRTNPDYYMRDPQTGQDMWSVYGYENKSRPGEFLFVMCAEYWCERDNLPLLKSEYEGTMGRGFSKPPNSCPFCGGGLIRDMSAPNPGESVIVRLAKESTGKLHSFIGTITRNKHPQGYPLPCCDTTPRLLKKYMDAAFYGRLEYGRDLAIDDDDDEDEEGGGGAAAAAEEAAPEPDLELGEAAAVLPEEGTAVDYQRILDAMPTQYILGNDKSLDAGKIGLLPPALDAFFGQSGPQSLESRGIRPTFRDGVYLFVRVGVDTQTRTPGLNLFAGLAPLLGFKSAEETKRDILQKRMVRAFESANYGTLVQEFAAKSRLTDAQINAKLAEFAAEYRYTLERGRAHIVRLYKAWVAFLECMNSPTQPKQLRHLEHLLAQPGVITPRGLLLIVLEQKGDHIEVICPSFGVPTASIFGDVPVAFMWHDKRDDSWEPIVMYNNTRSAVRLFHEMSPEIAALPRALQGGLRRWIRNWRDSSKGCGRPAPPPHVWTPNRDTRGLPRLSLMLASGRAWSVTALVRDRSNRLAGVLVTISAGAAAEQLFVPCLDDGNLAPTVPRIHEAEMIPLTPIDSYMRLYNALVAEYPEMRPVRLLTRMRSDPVQTVGFAVSAGAMIPVAPFPVATKTVDLPEQQVDEFPWERDALILRAPDSPATAAAGLEESSASVEEQLAEAYQHLRLSFSMWLVRDARGARVKADITALTKVGLPLYEKRKRMDLMLEPIIREMVATEETTGRRTLSLLRQDCLALPQADCGGACHWDTGREACLIHAPVRPGSGVEPVRVFAARLSDELLRYASPRDEVLKARVPEIRVPRGVVRVGNELYIATRPKESAGAIMERLGFAAAAPTAFPEEMLRFEGLEEEAAAVVTDESVLPQAWIDKGLTVATPAPDVEDARRLVFAAATGISIEDWETSLKRKRTDLGLVGPVDRPFQWSVQDFYVIATILRCEIAFVRLSSSGLTRVVRLVRPATGVKAMGTMVFWGENEYAVTQAGRQYRLMQKDMPMDLLHALDGASPISEEEARGSAPAAPASASADLGDVLEGAAAAALPALIPQLESAAAESAPQLEGEAAPKLVVTEAAAAAAESAPQLEGEAAPKLVVTEAAEEAP